MPDVGPHLLGRKPSPPDERDYRMADMLAGADSPLDLALASVLRSPITSPSVKRWAKLVTAAVEAPGQPTPSPTIVTAWHDPDQLDQGQTGHCVGFGWSQWGNCDPVNDHYTDAEAHKVYYECKVIDGEPGAEDGSNVRSGAKAMLKRSRLNAYVFASTLDEVKTWVQTRGPVVIGTDWTQDMFTPAPTGFVKPTGSVEGGHCYLLVGWDASDTLTFQNSWGSLWGQRGYFKMTRSDFATLFKQQGEACTAVELA